MQTLHRDSRGIFEKLIPLRSTSPVKAYYSKGLRARSVSLFCIAERSCFFLGSLFGTETTPVLLVLDINDWRRLLGPTMPYYVPSYSSWLKCIYTGDKIERSIVETFLKAFRNSPANLRHRLVSAVGTEKNAFEIGIQTLFDYLVVHEMTHCHAHTKKVNTGTFWLSEFLADYCTYAFVKDARDTQVEKIMDITYELIYKGGHSLVEHKSILDFEDMYSQVGFFNYEWYHAKFHRGARELYERFGTSFISAVIEEFEATDEKVVCRLDQKLKGFKKWFGAWK